MSHAIVAAVLVGHGFITSMIGRVAVTSPDRPPPEELVAQAVAIDRIAKLAEEGASA